MQDVPAGAVPTSPTANRNAEALLWILTIPFKVISWIVPVKAVLKFVFVKDITPLSLPGGQMDTTMYSLPLLLVEIFPTWRLD